MNEWQIFQVANYEGLLIGEKPVYFIIYDLQFCDQWKRTSCIFKLN